MGNLILLAVADLFFSQDYCLLELFELKIR
ncbi:hypothetical protein HMPREF1021_01193 [Coprobacillus sp. 3_3_56FAA]|nr:hypothetical protein HMPREF1021_01193 [Coprobacillus sp. 3_3_56FAA]